MIDISTILARQATFIGWHTGTKTLCHCRIYPPSQGLGIGPQLQLVEVRRDKRGRSMVRCQSGVTAVLSAHRCLIVFLHKLDTILKGYMSRDICHEINIVYSPLHGRMNYKYTEPYMSAFL
jgi:hypothetical protein